MFSHGNYELSVKDNIVNIVLTGSFNLEGSTKFCDELIEVIKSLNGNPYYIVQNVLNFEGGTPEAYKSADQANKWINENNPPIQRIFIIKDKTKLDIAMHEESELEKQNLLFFDTEEKAAEWLAENYS